MGIKHVTSKYTYTNKLFLSASSSIEIITFLAKEFLSAPTILQNRWHMKLHYILYSWTLTWCAIFKIDFSINIYWKD